MATSPVITFPMTLAAIVGELERNRAVPIADTPEYDQAAHNIWMLERAMSARANALLACDGVTLADIERVRM